MEPTIDPLAIPLEPWSPTEADFKAAAKGKGREIILEDDAPPLPGHYKAVTGWSLGRGYSYLRKCGTGIGAFSGKPLPKTARDGCGKCLKPRGPEVRQLTLEPLGLSWGKPVPSLARDPALKALLMALKAPKPEAPEGLARVNEILSGNPAEPQEA